MRFLNFRARPPPKSWKNVSRHHHSRYCKNQDFSKSQFVFSTNLPSRQAQGFWSPSELYFYCDGPFLADVKICNFRYSWCAQGWPSHAFVIDYSELRTRRIPQLFRFWKDFGDIFQAWIVFFLQKLKCELRKRHFWFFSRPENFLRRVPIRRRYDYFFKESYSTRGFQWFLQHH